MSRTITALAYVREAIALAPIKQVAARSSGKTIRGTPPEGGAASGSHSAFGSLLRLPVAPLRRPRWRRMVSTWTAISASVGSPARTPATL